ncbi:MAG: hypothetical protein K2Q26_07135 [Bdellovibrionales bacterium]|nr:hypothetical protein [Bdellovibrionales bacterium]
MIFVHGIIVTTLFFMAVIAQDFLPPASLRKSFIAPPTQIKHFTLGYNDLIASLIWIRVLQDIDYCEEGKFRGEDFVLPLETARDKLTGILERKLKPSKCNKGWVYKMLDALSEVEPRNKLVYDVGATFLSVSVDDREGARLIFEKGLTIYPQDWQIAFKAGYHYLWEIQDPKRAAQLLNQSVKSGGPPIVSAIAAALYSHMGQAQIAKMVLEDTLAQKPTGLAAERIKYRLEQVNKILSESDNK